MTAGYVAEVLDPFAGAQGGGRTRCMLDDRMSAMSDEVTPPGDALLRLAAAYGVATMAYRRRTR